MIALALRDRRRGGGALRPRYFVIMLLESAILAVAFGIVVGTITAQLLNAIPLAIGAQQTQMAWPTMLMVSLGAGIYE